MRCTPSAFCWVRGREPDPWSALHGPGTAPAGSPPASRPQPFSPAPSPSAPPRDAARAWGRGQTSRPQGGARRPVAWRDSLGSGGAESLGRPRRRDRDSLGKWERNCGRQGHPRSPTCSVIERGSGGGGKPPPRAAFIPLLPAGWAPPEAAGVHKAAFLSLMTVMNPPCSEGCSFYYKSSPKERRRGLD